MLSEIRAVRLRYAKVVRSDGHTRAFCELGGDFEFTKPHYQGDTPGLDMAKQLIIARAGDDMLGRESPSNDYESEILTEQPGRMLEATLKVRCDCGLKHSVLHWSDGTLSVENCEDPGVE